MWEIWGKEPRDGARVRSRLCRGRIERVGPALSRASPPDRDPTARPGRKIAFSPPREGVDIILPARGVHPRGWRGRRRSRRRGRRRRRASRRWWQPGGENGERHSWRPSCAVSLWFRLPRCFLHCIPVCPRVRLQVLGFLCLFVIRNLSFGPIFQIQNTSTAGRHEFVGSSATFSASSAEQSTRLTGPSTFPMSFARRALKPVAQYGAAAAYRQVRSRTRQRRGLGDAIADLFVSRAIEGARK